MKTPLADIRLFMLDMDGTFYLGEQLLPGALAFIATLRRQGKDFLFLTNNSSKHRGQYAEKITRLGLPIHPDQVLTSGEATALYLQAAYPGKKLFVAGTPSLEEEIRQHGFELAQDAAEVVVLGFDTTLTYAKLWKLCDYLRAGLPYIATHPDINCPTETGFMPDIGSFIACIQASTGRAPDVIIGKPNRSIAEAAARKTGYPLEQIAMVGDRLYTDIALGQTAGIVAVLVLSGETHPEEVSASPHQPDHTFAHLGALAEALIAAENPYAQT
jgi:HAD superfamily hydrolase (TIGR01457 family)